MGFFGVLLKYISFFVAMDGKHLNEVQKAFIEVMEELETNSTHPCNPSQLIVRVFDAVNYNHSGIFSKHLARRVNFFKVDFKMIVQRE